MQKNFAQIRVHKRRPIVMTIPTGHLKFAATVFQILNNFLKLNFFEIRKIYFSDT